jgi:HlyD family secretion protein
MAGPLVAINGPESPARTNRLMEEFCERENLKEVLRRSAESRANVTHVTATDQHGAHDRFEEVYMATAPSHIGPVRARPSVLPVLRPRTRPRPKWLKWVLAGGLVLALAAAGIIWRAHVQNAIAYETVPVERGTIQAKVTATGNLNAVVDVLVSSQVSGNIQALYADWNSKVKKGQLVAVIDPEIFQAQVDQASATFRSAHAATITAQAQLEKAKSDSSAANASEKNAEAIAAKDVANATNAKAQLARAEILLREQIIAQQDYDTAKANYDASQAQLSADKAQIDAAKQNIQSAQASVQVAQSQLETTQAQEHQAEAALQQAQINLRHTRIMAQVDGTVVARRMDVGQTVASTLNPPTIFEIAQDLTKMQVDTNVDESDVGNVAKGQKATFIVDSYPGTTFHGVVADIRKAPIITQNVVTYDVVITVDNSDLKLFPGMTANVTILTAKLDDTLKVPNSVLRFRPSAAVLNKTGLPPVQADKQQVYVLAGGKLEVVPVGFALSDGRYTAIVSGQLQPGAQVVVRATVSESSSPGSSTTSVPMAPRM